MKLKTFSFLLLVTGNLTFAQKHILLAPEAVPNCGLMKNGKFASVDYSPAEYHMVVADGIQTEYIENGQFVKSKMEFISDCEYRTTILEVTIPDYFAKPGDFLTTKILKTQGKYIAIKTTMFGKEYDFVYIKLD